MARTMGPSRRRPAFNADRLSDLPDGLLHHIMSFLTGRQAVQTCLLSRRWEDLWCSMPCLNIDQREFPAAVTGSEDWNEYDDEDEEVIDIGWVRFEDFASNLLLFHTAPTLDSFRLHVDQFDKIKLINRWLRRGFQRCPRVLEIHSTYYCKLPHLVSRGTSGSISTDASSRLSRLHLTGITLDATFTQRLHSNCPVLADLELKRCMLHNDAEISSRTLKSLTIEDCTTPNPSALTIEAPSLAYLQLVITAMGLNWQTVVVNEMPFLIKATICFKASTAMMACRLLFGLIHVKDLELTGLRTLANLHIGSGTFTVFHNVRTLLLDKCDLSDSCDILGSFLNNAPCLEELTLQHCKLPGNGERTSLGCQDTSSLQCPSLKRTEIKYNEDDDVQKLFDLLLGVWRNLQQSTIVINKA